MSKFRYIAPAGTPIFFSDLFFWLLDIVRGKDYRGNLCADIKEKYSVKHCFLMSSGRAAMAMIFQMLKEYNQDPLRNEIVLPSYTCYSVPAAAEIAGLKVRICDIDPTTLNYDMEQFESIDFNRVICVVTANLYGLPNDLQKIEDITKKHGCYLLDDAAQSMNARINHRYAGTFGDLGLFSLDKGKNITSLQGGIIVTNRDDMAEIIEEKISQLPGPSLKEQLNNSIKLLIYSILLKPYLYWIPANIPALGLGKTIYTTEYIFSKYSRSLASLAYRLFKRIDDISRQRKKRYENLCTLFSNLSDINVISLVDNSVVPACLRMPILVKDTELRIKLLDELERCGIGATVSYPKSIADLEQVQAFSINHNSRVSAGQTVAKQIVTLPTIPYLTSNDIQKISSILEKYV